MQQKQNNWISPCYSLGKIWIAGILLLCLLSSCATYRQQSGRYYAELERGNYTQAEKELKKNKLLKKERNRLLLLLEKGKLAHMQGKWEESNRYFNEADGRMESDRQSVGDITLGTLLNPMMKKYRAEDFEKYLIHYYKALNYLQLGDHEEALVEARRITLRIYMQDDKVGNKNKFSEDAFSLSLQGMIYEAAGDINNAFISYRNAANVYLENGGKHYGTTMPKQLKTDLLRLAYKNGFSDELKRFESIFGQHYQPVNNAEGGELIIFWESGTAPVKTQEDFFFSAVKGAGDGLFFSDNRGLFTQIPFDNRQSFSPSGSLTDLRGFRVVLPVYEAATVPRYSHAIVRNGAGSFMFEKAEDIQVLAVQTLKERMLRELSATLTRMAVKKLAESAVRNAGTSKGDSKMDQSESEKKKAKKEKATREALALGLQIFNLATEKADTRNWQSLPNTIYYTRVPLQKGANELNITLQGASAHSFTIQVNGTGNLQIMNITR